MNAPGAAGNPRVEYGAWLCHRGGKQEVLVRLHEDDVRLILAESLAKTGGNVPAALDRLKAVLVSCVRRV